MTANTNGAAQRAAWEAGPPPGWDDDSPRESPTSAEPLRGAVHLARVAVYGRTTLRELAAAKARFVWMDIAVLGTIILIAGGPGEGKTTLLFLILAARSNRGAAVEVLGRRVEPAAAGMWIVIVEGEHSESSAARKAVRSLDLLGVDDSALDRVLLIARKAVRLGSPEWDDIVRLVTAGLVSDIAIDTVARVAPAAADDEREQVALFDSVARAIEAAPSDETRPTVWAIAHTRKNGRTGGVDDVSGSAQRAGQADSVLLVAGEKQGGRTVSSRVTFAKLREEPDEYPTPVEFSIQGSKIVVTSETKEKDERPLETRILDRLQLGARTKNALSTELGRNKDDVDAALTELFSARRITTTELRVGGRPYKAFTLRSDAGQSTGRSAGPGVAQDEHGTSPDGFTGDGKSC